MRRGGNRGNVLTFGIILLIILVVAMFLIGRVINRAARAMNNAAADERSMGSFEMIRSEFERSLSLPEVLAALVAEDTENPAYSLSSAAVVLFSLDGKAGTLWLSEAREDTIVYVRNRDSPYTVIMPSAGREFLIDSLFTGTINTVHRNDSVLVWTLAVRRENIGGSFVLGVDITLPDIHRFMVERDLRSARGTYITIFSSDGSILYYPDSTRLGHTVEDAATLRLIRQTAAEGISLRTTVISDYLAMPSERFYYPLDMGTQRWVVSVTVPQFTFTDLLDDFHLYTAIIILVSVLLFTALLAYSQYRLRREHARRLTAEQNSAEQQMNRLLEQMKPHFLFNSLNSLYSLIKQDTALARQFVLKLSSMYRYVLERRDERLSSVSQELEFVCQYMFLQQTRFGDQIDLEIRVEPGVLEQCIPSMSLQNLLENAIKHNSFSPHAPLRIKIYTSGDTIIVENDFFPGDRPPVDSTGLGLESLQAIYSYYSSREVIFGRDGRVFRCILPLLDAEKLHS